MDEQKYSGMTVNERLFAAGLLDEFDTAVNHKNRDKVVALLQQVELSYEQAELITKTIFSRLNQKDSN
jgi:hypothetical protein